MTNRRVIPGDTIREEYWVERLKNIKANCGTDYQAAHFDADEVLCRFLVALGYKDVVDAWEEIGKWYA